MTWPRRKPKPVAERVAVDPAVQAILDQVVAEQIAPTPMFDPPPKIATFDRIATFTAPPKIATFDAPTVASFGATFTGKAGSFKGKQAMTPRRIFVLPPVRPPKWSGWFMPMCTFMNCFEDNGWGDVTWRVGNQIPFDEAAESNGYECVYQGSYYGGGHYAGREDWVLADCCPAHALSPEHANSQKEMLEPCDCSEFEFPNAWEQLVPRLIELRQLALAGAAALTEAKINLGWIFQMAGFARAPQFAREQGQMILDAVRTGVHDTGLAAAWADGMAIGFPEVFGKAGAEVADMISDIRSDYWLPDEPADVIVFDKLADHELRVPYLITSIEYLSALARPELPTGAYVGWRLLHVIPYDPICEGGAC